MGASLVYLDKPNMELESFEGKGKNFNFAVGAMQGWRINMEDQHITNPFYDGPLGGSIFGVFDGHGGVEVAYFVK